MKILITGGAGMLGRTLLTQLRAHELQAVGRSELDVSRPESVRAMFRALRPEVVIHAAAMTKVDACETEQDEAYRTNAIGSGNVAAACTEIGARLIAISTDYVFSGDLDRPYHEWDEPGPRTVYGRTKLAGERAIQVHAPNHLLLRVAWLYGPGGPSFVHTMLNLGSKEGPPLRVVNDQHGNPTSTIAVAHMIERLLDVPVVGTLHLTSEGETTWYEFTREIFRLKGMRRDVEACTTREYPRPAPRPGNSRLDNRVARLVGLSPMPDWHDSIASFLKEYPNG